MKITLRLAEQGDVPAIRAIEEVEFPCPWPERVFRGEVENDLATFKVLTAEERVIGYYDLWVCADEAHLLNVAVAAAERGRGHGTAMMEDVLEEAKRASCRRIVLEVRPGNTAAIKLYEKFGFVKVSSRPRYYADGEDADVMIKTL